MESSVDNASARKYVAGVDGSSASVAAARWAADRAARDGAMLILVHAYPVNAVPSVAGPIRTPAMRRTSRDHADRLMRAVAGQLPAGTTAEQRLVEGAADQVLLECSDSAELLVLGARPQHKHPHIRFIGSTASRCLRGSRCPVVIVPGFAPSRPRRPKRYRPLSC